MSRALAATPLRELHSDLREVLSDIHLYAVLGVDPDRGLDGLHLLFRQRHHPLLELTGRDRRLFEPCALLHTDAHKEQLGLKVIEEDELHVSGREGDHQSAGSACPDDKGESVSDAPSQDPLITAPHGLIPTLFLPGGARRAHHTRVKSEVHGEHEQRLEERDDQTEADDQRQRPKEGPCRACHHQDGAEGCDASEDGREHRSCDLSRAFDGRFLGLIALLHQSIDVLPYDDRVINDHSENDDQAEHHDHVEGDSHSPGQQQAAEEGDRDAQGGHEGHSRAEEEDERDEDQRSPKQGRLLHRPQPVMYIHADVRVGSHGDTVRQLWIRRYPIKDGT